MDSSASTIDDGPVFEAFSLDDADLEVEVKLDAEATSFTEQNAYFFAAMCKLSYGDKDDVRSALENKGFWGSGAKAGDRFQWFEADDEVANASTFDAIHDTEAFVAANDEAIMAVFRGSKGGRDWLTNLSILPRDIPQEWKLETEDGDLHRGFDDGVNTVWNPGPGHPEGMLSVIKRFYNEEGKSRKLFIAGHSLGGALATIAAARLAFVDSHIHISAVYTIGSPRVFDTEVADIFDATVNHGTKMKDKCFRSRNNNDIVTRVPPLPYKHVGKEIYFDRFGTISTTNLMDRLLGRFSALLRFSFLDGINDHSGSEYLRLAKQALINSRVSLLEKTKSVVVDAVQKVIPVNQEEVKEQEQGIKAAEEAALQASIADEEFIPEDVPDHLVQEDEQGVRMEDEEMPKGGIVRQRIRDIEKKTDDAAETAGEEEVKASDRREAGDVAAETAAEAVELQAKEETEAKVAAEPVALQEAESLQAAARAGVEEGEECLEREMAVAERVGPRIAQPEPERQELETIAGEEEKNNEEVVIGNSAQQLETSASSTEQDEEEQDEHRKEKERVMKKKLVEERFRKGGASAAGSASAGSGGHLFTLVERFKSAFKAEAPAAGSAAAVSGGHLFTPPTCALALSSSPGKEEKKNEEVVIGNSAQQLETSASSTEQDEKEQDEHRKEQERVMKKKLVEERFREEEKGGFWKELKARKKVKHDRGGTAWSWEYRGRHQDGAQSDWITEDEARDSFSPLQLDVFHALWELYCPNEAPRPLGEPSRGEREVVSRELALEMFPPGTKVGRVFMDAEGRSKTFKATLYDYCDPYWRVEYSDGDWEELTKREVENGIGIVAQQSSSA
eukprot:g9154.t1